MSRKFFQRSANEVAFELVGCSLVSRAVDGSIKRSMIIETEAYEGEEDLANHAARGRTSRTEVMYQPGGVYYVYLIYGMYYMLNIVTGERDRPSAVLLRSTDQVSGPGRLGKYFNISKDLNGQIVGLSSGLWIEGNKISDRRIKKLPRVGVDHAGPWALKPYRYLLE